MRQLPPSSDARPRSACLPRNRQVRNSEAELQTGLRRATAGQTHDLYVVIVPAGAPFGTTNQGIGGIGIVQASSLLNSTAWVHALFTVRVYDGKTHEQLGWKIANAGQTRFMATIKGPHREVDISWWPQPDKVAGDARLKTAIHELVAQAVATTLPEALALQVAQGNQGKR